MEWFQIFLLIYNQIRPILDILILAFLLYKAYELLTKTQAVQLIKGAGVLVLVYGAAVLFRFTTVEWILQSLAPGLFIALAIVFQPELRKIFLRMGQAEFFKPDSKQGLEQVEAVVAAAEVLSREKRGMLIVFPRRTNITDLVTYGTMLNADISTSLIVAIFEHDTPLHDGAMIIHKGRIEAAGCILPLSEQDDIRKSFGTRHRASLGMSEQSDAVVLVVSEETGAISLAFDNKLYYDLSALEVTKKLREFLDPGLRRKKTSYVTQDTAEVRESGAEY